jgi:hypothetical protein
MGSRQLHDLVVVPSPRPDEHEEVLGAHGVRQGREGPDQPS